jgi:hypothetical protein
MFLLPVIKKPVIPNIEYGFCKKIILFTNARDESHIKEWAAHHLLLGFDCVYIFDHKSKIPIRREFQQFSKRVIVERCEMEGSVKIPLMNRAVNIAKKRGFDWMLYLDADEFLVLNRTNHVKNMLNRFKRAHSIAVNWLMFGSNHHVKEPSGLIIENYTKSDETLHSHVKTFVRPREVLNVINPHFYIIRQPLKSISVDFKRMNPNPLFSHCNDTNKKYNQVLAFISHYYYQSEETFSKRKMNRKRDDTGEIWGFTNSNFIHNEFNTIENDWVKNKYAKRVKKFLSFFENKKNQNAK